MAGTRKREAAAAVPFERLLREHMQNREFEKAYKELEPEFEIVRQIIDLRIQRGMTQEELARKLGTQQSSISRLESRRQSKDLEFLRRVAEALDARLEVRLVPREMAAENGPRHRKMKA